MGLVRPSDGESATTQYGPLWWPGGSHGELSVPSPSLFVDGVEGWYWNGIYCLSSLHTDCRFFGFTNAPNWFGATAFPQYGHDIREVHGERYTTAESVIHTTGGYAAAEDAGYHGSLVKYGAGTVKSPAGRGSEG